MWKPSTLVSVVILLLLGACSQDGQVGAPEPGPSQTAVGSLVITVDERALPRDVLKDATDGGAVLLTTQDERDLLATTLSRATIEDVDLSTHVIVAGSYARCTETSSVLLDADREPPGLTFSVHDPEPKVDCAASPLTVDVWTVPLAQTGGRAPDLLGSTPSGPSASGGSDAPDPGPPLVTVGALVATVDESTLSLEALVDAVEGDVVRITTGAERDDLAQALAVPGEVVEAVKSVDLSTHVVVAGGYPRCTEVSRVLLDAAREPPGLTFSVHDPEPGVLCAWSPFTVDVWAVPLAEVGEQRPELLR